MASFSSPVGTHPTQVDPLRDIIDDIQGELHSDQRVRFLGLVEKQLGAADHHRLQVELGGDDGDTAFIKVFDTLIDKMGETKAVDLSINAFSKMGLYMSHGKQQGKPIDEILCNYVKDRQKHEDRTGLKDQDFFIGREKEVVSVMELLQTAKVRAVSVTGMRGVGKTALAHKVCYRMSWKCHFGVYKICLRGATSVDTMFNEILSVMDVLPCEMLSTNDLKAAVIHQLKLIESETIFFLDNVDQLCHSDRMEGFFKHLRDVLARVSNDKVKFLFTSTNTVQYGGAETPPKAIDGIRSHFSGTLQELELDILPIDHCVKMFQRLTSDTDIESSFLVMNEDFKELSGICKQRPLLIFLVQSRLKESRSKPKELIRVLRERSLRSQFAEVDEILKDTYLALGADYQDAILKLSLFQSVFDVSAATSILGEDCSMFLQVLLSRRCLGIDNPHRLNSASRSDSKDVYYVPSLIRDFLGSWSMSERQTEMIRDARAKLCSYFHAFLENACHKSETGKNSRVLKEVIRYYQSIVSSLRNLDGIHLPDISRKSEFLKALHMFNVMGTPIILRQDKERLELFQKYFVIAESSGNQLFAMLARLFIAQQHFDYLDTTGGWKDAEAILNEVESPIKGQLRKRKSFKGTGGTDGCVLLYAHYCFVRAQVLYLKKDYQQASAVIGEARSFFTSHAQVLHLVRIINQQALIADFQGKFDIACQLYAESFEMAKKVLGSKSHPFLITVYMNCGACCHLQGHSATGDKADKYSEAGKWYDEAIKVMKKYNLDKSSLSLKLLCNYSKLCLEGEIQNEKALKLAECAHEVAVEFKKDDPIEQVRATILLGFVLKKMAEQKRFTDEFTEYADRMESIYDSALDLCRRQKFLAEDIGRGDPTHDYNWKMLFDYPGMLIQREKLDKFVKTRDMLINMENGSPIAGTDSEHSRSSSSSPDCDAPMGEDTGMQGLPPKIPRLVADEDSSSRSVEFMQESLVIEEGSNFMDQP